jgi:hypothetical protein
MGYLAYLKTANRHSCSRGVISGLFFGGAIVLAIILELCGRIVPTVSPWQPGKAPPLAMTLPGGSKQCPFVYWDYQNPGYISLLTTCCRVVMFAGAR